MKEYFARLSSLERRFVVGVLLVVFLLLNWWFVWPRFGDWKKLSFRGEKADNTLKKFNDVIEKSGTYETAIKKLVTESQDVPPESMAIELIRVIQNQAALSHVQLGPNNPLTPTTNQNMVEIKRSLQITAGEPELVDFLYNLGAGPSLIRVRSLSMRPDAPHHALGANLTLVASYQKETKKETKPRAAAATPKPTAVPAAQTNKPASAVPAPPKSATPTKK